MRILLTAFEPYGEWQDNSSWLVMQKLLRDSLPTVELTTRRYPVDLPAMTQKLEADLARNFEAILHLGQSPGSASVKLETIAINVAGCVEDAGLEMPALDESGPVAFRTRMPVARWAEMLRHENIPAAVSYHAGTYLCNAVMYLSHRWHHTRGPHVPVGFMHLPLATEQVAASRRITASLPLATLTRALELVLNDLANSNRDEA